MIGKTNKRPIPGGEARAAADPEAVEFGLARGLSVTGHGALGGPAYTTSMGALQPRR
ncbi:hypothetical protein AB0M44_40155 [Streptosporangium subroseum]|uniref:hypothetical protein n=1 Tax=Streptosporangium subroseum TaxID=106412 RepID=UPI003434955E